MAPSGDLQIDLDGLGVFAGDLDKVRGQWDGSAVSLDPHAGLGDDTDMTGTIDDFGKAWARAATSIDTFVTTLSGMCRDAVAKYQQTDTDLSDQLPVVHNHREYAV